jgi:hypothetical protein
LSSTPFKYSCTMMPPAFFAEDYLIYLEMNSPVHKSTCGFRALA